MLRIAGAVILSGLIAGPAAAGQFKGTLKFEDPDCVKGKECRLADWFGYTDSTGYGWQAQAGDVTDGASIPPVFRLWIGHPFDEDLIRAAVIHDHYCLRRVMPWRDTHWVFFDALLASGVERRRARLMYAAVLLGGPKWIWLAKGQSCEMGANCTMSLEADARAIPGNIITDAMGERYATREARYNDPEFNKELDALESRIDSIGAGDDRAAIEALAAGLRPDDAFLNGPSTIVRVPAGIAE